MLTQNHTRTVKGFMGQDSVNFIGDKYLRIVGALGYAAKTTRPDIQYAYSYLSRFASKPTMALWKANNRKQIFQH